MSHPKFDRERLFIRNLAERKNKLSVETCMVFPGSRVKNLSDKGRETVAKFAGAIRKARENGRAVILASGAHTIKNGLAPVLIGLMNDGWISHLATNGAGIIHDWEFAFQGLSSEDVRENVRNGCFGIWEETGRYINLALTAGAYEGLGYGQSVGKMIAEEGLFIPDPQSLRKEAAVLMSSDPGTSAAAIEFAGEIEKRKLKSGFMSIPHPYKNYSVQAFAWQNNIPFTGHPMFGHDIIYNHPWNNGASVGRTALNDFLMFAASVSDISNGVYMSLGSAVMSPMIFEKALSMAQNTAIQNNRHIEGHHILVVDLAESEWDWTRDGEPPMDNPAYYLRYCKTFNRMGGEMEYLTADNRDFLLQLYEDLR